MLAWERTRSIAKVLDARVILFQCPASFVPDPQNVSNFRRFFETIERSSYRLAWEPRGDWPLSLVDDLCRDLDLMHCLDPLGDAVTRPQAPYWRLHGKGGYHYRYTDGELTELARTADVCRPQYVFFNNIWMKQDALRFLQLATAAG